MYFIEGFPMPFHDLVELFEFLSNCGKLVWMFQYLTVFLGSCPIFWINILWEDKLDTYLVTYQDYPRNIG